MHDHQDRPHEPRGPMFAMLQKPLWLAGLLGLFGVGSILVRPAMARTQRSTTPTSLVFDGVTVIDVQQGRHIPAQRVVIVGNHIRAVGNRSTVRVPAGARVVNARGKYLIPGLWDMHTHPRRYTSFFYPLLIANGVTGIRDAGSEVPLDSQILQRREILTGTRVGPPRQLLGGLIISDDEAIASYGEYEASQCTTPKTMYVCTDDSVKGRHLVDSLKTAGADFIKTYALGTQMYFVIASEARRIGIPFGGHLNHGTATAIEASDSGARILDHLNTSGDLYDLCLGESASVEQCQPVAARFQHNGTWFVPTLIRHASEADERVNLPHVSAERLARFGLRVGPGSEAILRRFYQFVNAFWGGTVFHPGWLNDSTSANQTAHPPYVPTDSSGFLHIIHRVGLPILAGTDAGVPVMRVEPPGFALHMELAMYVAEGLTPLEALQTATLNPARYLHGTDSLGTVAPGKLADLVLLDADPLTAITNTTRIRAVVANGRYFDRVTLDQLIAAIQAKVKQDPQLWEEVRLTGNPNRHR